VDDLLVRGRVLTGGPGVTALGPGLLAPLGSSEGVSAGVPGSLIPHTRGDVRVLVDLKAATELRNLSPQSLDLASALLGLVGLTPQLLQALLGDDDLVVLVFRGQVPRR